MAIRLWPQDYERKDHITKAEKALLRNAARNFQSGHIAVGIDPLGLSNEKVHMGMYISPSEGLITFSIYQGKIMPVAIPGYINYVQDMVEKGIYERLLDSKMLIVRNGDRKILKFPYKHIIMFPDETVGKVSASKNDLEKLKGYATLDFFRPLTSNGKEKRIEDLGIFTGIRIPYDSAFKSISDSEARAIFERLAPEYTVVMNEVEHIQVRESKTAVTKADLRITGNEQEYKTFFLDEYQVSQVNDMGKGHRVILANPGAGKSVLLLSKAFKYASIYKESQILLTCYNSNLAESYAFKRACANFGNNNNLHIMTFHKLVNKIYQEFLHMRCDGFFATDDEVQKCIDYVKAGKVTLRFKAIFIDEVQNFNPLYLELCYLLLEDSEDRVFLMAGDLNQSIRAKSRKGDVPWKQIRGANLDFTGRVRYIEKNYRNTREIGEYLVGMLTLMNKRLDMLGMINQMEYEYNSFTLGDKPTLALNIETGINRMDIKAKVIAAIKEIAQDYKVSYSDIAVLFPFRQQAYRRYYFLNWLKDALDEEGISYSMIISENNGRESRRRYSDTSGVVISTIESSLGLDFKAVILAGLYPYNYVNIDGQSGARISSWASIKDMNESEQEAVQSQMRSMYTACSRARDVLYVLSDLSSGSPMEEILRKNASPMTPSPNVSTQSKTDTSDVKPANNGQLKVTSPRQTKSSKELTSVKDHCMVEAVIKQTNKPTKLIIDLAKYPRQKTAIGKKVGEEIDLGVRNTTYVITRIYVD